MEKKKLVDPTEMEIKLSFYNYKLLKKEEFNLKGSHIYFVKGPNEVGKSTILQALRAVHEMKDETPQKVSLGETEGVNEFKIPGADGRMYSVRYEFTDTTTKFVVFDSEGNKISKITDMRAIFRYNHIDSDTFITWSRSADGRRKQKDLVLNLLPSDVYLTYKEIELEIDKVFTERTQENKKLDLNKGLLNEYKHTEDDIRVAGTLEAAELQLKERKAKYEEVLTSGKDYDKILYESENIKNLIKRGTETLKDIDEDMANLLKRKEEVSGEVNKLIKLGMELDIKLKAEDQKQKDNDTQKEKLRLSVENGTSYVENARSLRTRIEKYHQIHETVLETDGYCNHLTEQIEEMRCEKEKLITSAKFPVDKVSFDEEGYLTINGLRFDETQTCESDTILIVAQLLCKMNDTPIQVLGDASLLDYKKLDKLYEIAKENGKIMFVDEIDRELDKLVIVGYEPKDKKADKPEKKADKVVKEIDNTDPNKPLF